MQRTSGTGRGLMLALALLAAVLGFVLGRFSAPTAAPSEHRTRGATTEDARSERSTALSAPEDDAPAPQRADPARDARTPLATQDEPGARVEGYVVDEDGRRVGGALLLLGEDPVYPLVDAREIGKSAADGALELAERLLPSERHVVAHLFALSDARLGWVQLAVPDGVASVHVGELRLAHSARVVALVVDELRAPLAGVEVEARARFYPVSGVFDARRDAASGTPSPAHAAVRELFRARTDADGRALFERLPAPHAAGIYELVVDDARFGRGSTDLEQAGAGAEDSVVIRVRRAR